METVFVNPALLHSSNNNHESPGHVPKKKSLRHTVGWSQRVFQSAVKGLHCLLWVAVDARTVRFLSILYLRCDNRIKAGRLDLQTLA